MQISINDTFLVYRYYIIIVKFVFLTIIVVIEDKMIYSIWLCLFWNIIDFVFIKWLGIFKNQISEQLIGVVKYANFDW